MQIKHLPEKISLDNSDKFLIQDDTGTTKYIKGEHLGSGSSQSYIQISHTVSSGTNGGYATIGAWTDRPINLINIDETSSVTLSSNTFVLPSGVYYVEALSTFYGLSDAKLRLYNKTASSTLIQGINGWVNPTGTVALPLWLKGQFVIAAGQSLSLQYYVKNDGTPGSQYNYGGSVSDGSLEKYASIDLWKVA